MECPFLSYLYSDRINTTEELKAYLKVDLKLDQCHQNESRATVATAHDAASAIDPSIACIQVGHVSSNSKACASAPSLWFP